jgi:hypothetical protein
MMREAFGTRKRFLGVPKVSFAGWVGTILHSTMAEESRIEALVLWLDGGNWERKKYGAQKHPSCTLELLPLQYDDVNKNT